MVCHWQVGLYVSEIEFPQFRSRTRTTSEMLPLADSGAVAG